VNRCGSFKTVGNLMDGIFNVILKLGWLSPFNRDIIFIDSYIYDGNIK
jgi:hypothetical protein